MTIPRDAIGLSERLRAAHPNSMQRINGSDILLEAATALDALQAQNARLTAERDEARLAANLGCEARNGGPHTIMSDGSYKFCTGCGETIRTPSLRERARAAESRALRAEQERDEAYERANNAENDLRVLWSADQASIRICEYCDAWMTIEEAARVDDASLCPQEAYGSTKLPDEKCFKRRAWLIKEDQSAIRRLAAGTEKEKRE